MPIVTYRMIESCKQACKNERVGWLGKQTKFLLPSQLKETACVGWGFAANGNSTNNMILAVLVHFLMLAFESGCVDVQVNNLTLVMSDVVVASLNTNAPFPPNVTVVQVHIQLTTDELNSGVLLLRSASVAAASEATVLGDADLSSSVNIHTPSVLKSANTTVIVSYNCSDTFILLEEWNIVVNQTVVTFEFSKGLLLRRSRGAPSVVWNSRVRADCRLQGCISGCANGGLCNYFYGECECQRDYYGDDCGLYWKTPTTVCPGSVMEMQYSVEDSPAANGDWWGLYPSDFHDAVSDQIGSALARGVVLH
jgi:hypothetical protein